jgi:maleylacetate reductase
MRAFVHDLAAPRVVFGAGRLAALPDEAARLGLSRILVVATPGQRALGERIAQLLGNTAAGLHANARMHVPADVATAALADARDRNADGVVAIGGGSAIGLGKMIARDAGLPLLAVPTTYSGSEMTALWGVTADGVKTTGTDPKVMPRTVIYDPELTVALPPAVSATSSMNAIAHAVEALYAAEATPLTDLMAEQGIAALARGLPRVMADPADLAARGDALYGAWLCAAPLGAVSLALHHKLCHTLGGTFDLPHAEVHTVVLPHATAYNAKAAPEAMRRIASALNARDAAGGLFDLAKDLGAPTSLRELGMPEDGLDKAADLAVAKPYPNPAPLTRDAIRALLDAAYHGKRPGA